ncbi:MAG TPA: GNAT family N-acetyltransferase [Vicinamibacterales bacterium]|nr:GNAT family N-acetyltransferase [Acidobacteriota bacterium]HOC17880.1 GNAT family N-acetyltransferase [Vicinamibacterales bacterium]
MPRPVFGAKPAVLRCARCGRGVDWEEARLQAVCGCRPHLDLPAVLIRQAGPEDAAVMEAIFRRHYGRTALLAFGEALSLENCPAIVAELKGEVAGALAYRLQPRALHVVALATDPLWQRSGVASQLLAEAEVLAARHGLNKLVASTSNDNLPSLYLFQRRGWLIDEVVPGALLSHAAALGGRGFGGIPVRDEVRLAKQVG